MLNATLGWLFRGFNGAFAASTAGYERLVRCCLRGAAIAILLYVGLLGLTYFGFTKVPTGFVPDQDKGYLVVSLQLPDAASLERTEKVMARIDRIAAEIPGVAHRLGIAGQSFLLGVNGSNFASMFVVLDEFDKRHAPDRGGDAIAAQLRGRLFTEIQEAQVAVFGAPPVDGLGNAGGFKIMIEVQGGGTLAALQGQVDNLVEKGNQQPGLVGLFSMFRADTPQLYLDVDRTKCKTMGVKLNDLFDALQVYLGGYYVNDFNQFGRTWQVNLQANARFRLRPEDLQRITVRNDEGKMLPVSTLAQVRDSSGTVFIDRYNLYPAAAVNGDWTPGVSSGQAMQAVEALAREELPNTMVPEWTELSYQEQLAGNTALLIFPLCILFVFLTHSAEYESWSLPLAIILIVPMSLLCALAGVWLRRLDNNLFTQIGFVVLAGLACKNAVLIVEFAKQQREHGLPRLEAAVAASKLRLRPIMMTSFAFILGVVPLVVASGAGAEMRRTLGTAVFSGMLGVTFFGIFLTPVFYLVLQAASEWYSGQGRPAAAESLGVAHEASPAPQDSGEPAPPSGPPSVPLPCFDYDVAAGEAGPPAPCSRLTLRACVRIG